VLEPADKTQRVWRLKWFATEGETNQEVCRSGAKERTPTALAVEKAQKRANRQERVGWEVWGCVGIAGTGEELRMEEGDATETSDRGSNDPTSKRPAIP
jgi:hypothetical protein